MGVTVWAVTGCGPNPLEAVADEAICVESPTTAAVQEVHLVVLHVICEGLDRALGVDEATNPMRLVR